MRDSHHDQEDVGQQGVLEQGVDEAVDVRPAAGNDLVVVLEVKSNQIIEGPKTKRPLTEVTAQVVENGQQFQRP